MYVHLKRDSLGAQPLADQNCILLAKITRLHLKDPDALWSRVLHSKYGKLYEEQDLGTKRPSSVIWRGIKWGYTILSQGLEVEVDTSIEGVRKVRWKSSTTGEFTTRSVYALLELPARHAVGFNWTWILHLNDPSLIVTAMSSVS